ncbi:DinB family protein [Pseudoduganella chitinolytica]|uniref:DinB family protein n=1 Tax=Pseudoduganella chitinolytica TaxID=34070 RepID=A0ABY8BHL2_9BURK|nr:DinB family protein [Pseudoduganella chitinolytica]WEF35156.1 DinB family protein [Pseudoduganella chitinolytica]
MTENRLARHLRAGAYNNAWANHRLLRACSELDQEAFAATDRTSFFPGIGLTLNHLVTAQQFYVDALWRQARGQPPHPDYRAAFFAVPAPYATCAALWQAQRDSDAQLIAYCDTLTDAVLDEEVTILRPDQVQRDTRERLLVHLLQHQVHHRGQVHAMLAGTDVAPPQLDEFYASGEAPLRAQDFAELGWTEEQVWQGLR